MRNLFNLELGLSDHTMGISTPIASVALGTVVIEKHFTLSRKEGGVDAAFSMEPDELKSLVVEVRNAWFALGEISYNSSLIEEKSKLFRRSLYFVKSLSSGQTITEEHIRCIRPGYGISPNHYRDLIGKRVNKDIMIGSPVSNNDII